MKTPKGKRLSILAIFILLNLLFPHLVPILDPLGVAIRIII